MRRIININICNFGGRVEEGGFQIQQANTGRRLVQIGKAANTNVDPASDVPNMAIPCQVILDHCMNFGVSLSSELMVGNQPVFSLLQKRTAGVKESNRSTTINKIKFGVPSNTWFQTAIHTKVQLPNSVMCMWQAHQSLKSLIK